MTIPALSLQKPERQEQGTLVHIKIRRRAGANHEGRVCWFI